MRRLTAPETAHDSSPSHTGTVGADPRNACIVGATGHEQICIVPSDRVGIPAETVDDSGAPVEPTACMTDRSTSSPGLSPAFQACMMYGAETPELG
jgi:hypothetical protein